LACRHPISAIPGKNIFKFAGPGRFDLHEAHLSLHGTYQTSGNACSLCNRKNFRSEGITMQKIFLGAGFFFALLFSTAHAAPIPAPVEEMIRAAGPGQIETIAEVAKMTNPDSVAEIDMLVASITEAAAAQRETQLASQGFFEGWSGEGQVGGFVTSGNTKDSGIAVGVKLNKEGLHWRHAIDALADLQRSNGVKTREAFRLGYEADYFVANNWFVYGLLQWQRDKFAGYSRRFTESLGIGHIIWDSPAISFEVNGGPALRQTRFIATSTLPARNTSKINVRGTGLFAWTIRDGLKFTEEVGVLWGSGNSTYYSRSALTASLTDVLSARLSFDVDHETRPPPGVARTDTATRASLVYDF
jgi:putative salt-induced outer membrane protein